MFCTRSGSFANGFSRSNPTCFAEALQHLEVELVAPVPALDRTRRERELREADDALGIEEADRAQAVAARAGAERIVEREQPRLELGQRVVADRARELRRVQVLAVGVHLDGDRTTVAVAERDLERLGEPLLELRADLEPVDDDLDRVLAGLRELRHRVDLVHLAVDAQPHEALRAQLGDEVQVLALPVDDDRREDHQLRVLGHRQRRIDHLRDRHRGELLLRMVRAVRVAHAREQQAQVVVDLGHRPHGRARVVRRRLLLDRDRRRQALDQVDVRLFHQLQELARIRRQRLDIAALAFRIERVERERALARSRQPRDHDQPQSRQVEVQVLQVVRARTADADQIHSGTKRGMHEARWRMLQDRRRKAA